MIAFQNKSLQVNRPNVAKTFQLLQSIQVTREQ